MQQIDKALFDNHGLNDDLGVVVHQDVLFDPRYSALYTATGELIESSILTRGNGEKVTVPPLTIELEKSPRYLKDAIFINSFGFPHFGHFLLEQVAKLWFCEMTDLPVIFHNNAPKKTSPLYHSFAQLPEYQKLFINNLSNFAPNRLMFTTQQIIIDRVIIPNPSFVIRHRAHSNHRKLCQQVAQNIKVNTTKQGLVYLSRSKLPPSIRKVKGELELESRLKELGVTIIHPEKLSFAQQIQLINNSETIIGTVGSALHTLLFSISPNAKVITLANPSLNTNYLLIDKLMQLNNNYIECLTDFEKASDDVILDVEAALLGINNVLAYQ